MLRLTEITNFIYGRDLILLQKCSGELIEVQEKLKKLVDVPTGSVYTRKTTGKNSKYNQVLYINGKKYHVSQKVSECSEEELLKKYGKNFNLQDYSFKENVLLTKKKIEQREIFIDEINLLKKNINRLKNNLNLYKNKTQHEITDTYIEKLGKQYVDLKNRIYVHNREREHKINIARTGTSDASTSEFASETQKIFYAMDGRIIETYAGESVRSKNELIIANIMKRIGVLYMYEYFVQDIGQNCDFVFLAGGKIYYLEVLGMMENEQYRQRWENKEKIYKRIGLINGDKLIVLNLSANENLEERKIEQLFYDIAAKSTYIEK